MMKYRGAAGVGDPGEGSGAEFPLGRCSLSRGSPFRPGKPFTRVTGAGSGPKSVTPRNPMAGKRQSHGNFYSSPSACILLLPLIFALK